MRGPKQTGSYPDRELDCQEDMADGFTDRFDREVVFGSAREDGRLSGIREHLRSTQPVEWNDVIADAVNAGWSEQEAQAALAFVLDGMAEGEAGTDPNE